MPATPHEQPLTAFLVEGLGNSDRLFYIELFKRMGHAMTLRTLEGNIDDFSMQQAPVSQLEAIRRHGYRFEDIRSPQDIVVAEHVHGLNKTTRPMTRFTNAWKLLVNGEGLSIQLGERDPNITSGGGVRKWRQIAEPRPLDGIQLVKRAGTGLPPYKGRTKTTEPDPEIIVRNYGIVAGSIPAAINRYVYKLGAGEKSYVQTRVLQDISRRLREQFDNS